MFDGRGGLDELELIRGFAGGAVDRRQVALGDTDLKLSGEIKYAGFDTFSYLGDATASKMEINGLNFAKLDLDGGGGDDSLKDRRSQSDQDHRGGDEPQLRQDRDPVQGVQGARRVGDESASKMEVADFSGLVKLALDGRGGGDELSLIRGLPAVQLTADKLLLTDGELKFR